MKHRVLFAFLLSICVMTIACTSTVPLGGRENQVGTIYLAAIVPTSSVDGEYRAIATISYHGMQRMIELTETHADDFIGTINAIPIGDWSVEIRFFDPDGDVTHVARGTARVRAGMPTTLRLEALPLEGLLEVTVDLGSVFASEDVQGARLSLTGNRYTTLTASEDQPHVFTGERELPPGDHDFQIVLYGDSFNVGGRIYASPWQTARIYPGKTTHVTWHPETAELSIETILIDFPGPPTNLTATQIDAETIRLDWTPPQRGHVVGYKVYLKEGDLSAYQLVAETVEPHWDLSTELLTGEPTWVVVTAVGLSEQESFRTEPVRIAP